MLLLNIHLNIVVYQPNDTVNVFVSWHIKCYMKALAGILYITIH